MSDTVLNMGWPTTWRQRMPFDNNLRSHSIVIDPWVFIVPSNNDHYALLEHNQWLNRQGANHFYRNCQDPDRGIAREKIQNFQEINTIDYKLYSINLSNHAAARLLNRILTNPQPRKLLHISMDDQQCRYPEHLMDTFRRLEFTGQLAIEIVESCALRFSIDRAHSYRQCFPIDNPNLLSIDYHYNFENKSAVMLDLINPTVEPFYYSSVVSKLFQ
jgi:hypothetical protein